MSNIRKYCRESRVPITTVFVLLFLSTIAMGQENDPHAHHKAMAKKGGDQAFSMELDLPDADLVTQDGDAVRLASDVIGDRIVVVDFIYTTCTTVCPVLSAVLSQVQAKLGDRLGSDVLLVSITVDPNRDTPARLKAYSGKLGAREGWTWLTGDKTVVDGVLKAFGAYTPNFEDHPSMIVVGDGASGEWGRFLGFPAASQILTRIDELSASRSLAALTE